MASGAMGPANEFPSSGTISAGRTSRAVPGDGVSLNSRVQRLEARWMQSHPATVQGDFINDFGCCSVPFFPGHLLTLQLTFSVILGMTQSHLISFFPV